MSNRELSKLYKEAVAPVGRFVESRHIVRGYSESVSLYRKKGDKYELIGDIDDDFYDSTLSKYIKLGSADSVELRKSTKDTLEAANGLKGDNLNIYQSYVVAGNFDIKEENRRSGESFLQQCILNNTLISVGSFLRQIYGDDIIADNEYFKDAWVAVPATSEFGHDRAGAGELFLAFFCNGKKPTKGDLHVGDKNIEVKGFGGRLYKSKKIDKQEIMQELISKDLDNVDDILDKIVDTISSLAGTTKYKKDIQDIIENNSNIREKVFETYDALTERYFNISNTNIFMTLASVAHLLAYKETQGFDSIIAFSQSKKLFESGDLKNISEKILMQFINLSDITTVAEMFTRLQSLDGNIRIIFNGDGSGFPMALDSSSSEADSSDEQGSVLKKKTLRTSARKVDTKDIGIGSMLDAQ